MKLMKTLIEIDLNLYDINILIILYKHWIKRTFNPYSTEHFSEKSVFRLRKFQL